MLLSVADGRGSVQTFPARQLLRNKGFIVS